MPIYGSETGGFTGSANLAGTESPNHVLNAIESQLGITYNGHQQLNFIYEPKRLWDDNSPPLIAWPAGGSDCWLISPNFDATYYRPSYIPPQSEQLYTPVPGTGTWARYLTDTGTTPHTYRFMFDGGLDIMVARNYKS